CAKDESNYLARFDVW
nr:immunoglobulin heavy chain junction region [Macaca mulatta]